jgi:hypothetical protein
MEAGSPASSIDAKAAPAAAAAHVACTWPAPNSNSSGYNR